MVFVKLTKAAENKKSGYVVGQVEDDTNKLYYLDKDGTVGELENAVVFSSKKEALEAAKKAYVPQYLTEEEFLSMSVKKGKDGGIVIQKI